MTPAVHPELRRIARVLPRRGVTGRWVPVLRALGRLQSRRPPSDGEIHAVGDAYVRLHHPPDPGSGPHPAVLWVHGGGFVIGTPAQDDGTCRRLARDLGAVVAAVGYRLAPEHPFPAPLEDCHDALVWLAGRDDVDADRVAIAGASAGGGLAAGLALFARDRAEVSPVAQVLVYPMLDDRTVLRRDLDDLDVRLWDNRANRFGWRSYTGQTPGSPHVSGLAAPARHEDLTGLPPAWIGVGTLDLFHDEDVAYAERLRAAGVEADLHVVDGAFHGFDALRPQASISEAFVAGQVAALAAALADPAYPSAASVEIPGRKDRP